MQILDKPSLPDAEPVISRALRDQNLLIAIGSCTVHYHGRAASHMAEGERVLMIKEDRSLTVHKKDRHAPVNYQTAGCEIRAFLDNEHLVVESFMPKVKDKLEVHFTDLSFVGAFKLQDSEAISVMGQERDLAKLVMAEPDIIEKGLKLETSEKMTAHGAIDVYFRDAKNNFVVVELKRRVAGLNEVNQLRRYVEELQKEKKKGKIRGILCAPRVSDRAKKMLHEFGLEFRRLNPDIEKLKNSQLEIVKDQKRLLEF